MSLPFRVVNSFLDSSRNWEWFYNTFQKDPSSLSSADASTVDTTYGSQEADVINNLRTRLNELEDTLQEKGLLE